MINKQNRAASFKYLLSKLIIIEIMSSIIWKDYILIYLNLISVINCQLYLKISIMSQIRLKL